MSSHRRRTTARLWVSDRGTETWQSLSGRPVRTLLSIVAAALAASAFLGLTGASRISEAKVTERLDRLRPNYFSISPVGDFSLATPALADQVHQVKGLSGVTGATLIALVDAPDSAPSPHPAAYPPSTSGDISIYAVTAAPAAALGASLAAGREIDEGHVRRGDQVVEIGRQAAIAMGLPSLRGAPYVFLNRRAFNVVGVIGPVTVAPELGSSIMLPYTTAQAIFGDRALQIQQVVVRGHPEQLPGIQRLAPLVFRPDRPEAIQITGLGDPVSLRYDLSQQLAQLVNAVTLATLLFGALVVGITSFSSIFERQQEFGVRRAVGARTGDIAGLVVAETTAVGMAGGVLGLALGSLGIAIASATNAVAFPLSVMDLLAAPALGVLVGLAAGVLPAIAATRVDPHSALTT